MDFLFAMATQQHTSCSIFRVSSYTSEVLGVANYG